MSRICGELIRPSLSERIESEATSLIKHRAEKAGLMDHLLTGRVRVTPLLGAANE